MTSPTRYFSSRYDLCEGMTDRARCVLAAAHQVALEQRSAAIEPEHVLRALATGDRGVGRCALEALGTDLPRLLPKIVELIPPHMQDPPAGPEFGPRGEALLAAARSAAAELNHLYLGTEHLVLALLREPSPIRDLLRQNGVTYESAFEGVKRLLGQDA
jgi:ATP-dependent Clp protease ATP-binding subunit ClpA